jgi:PEP-CTERM motif
MLLLMAGMLALATAARAATTVNAGSIIQVNGPGSLDLTGNIIYAVDFQNELLVNQTVNGVTFVNDNTPPAGFSSVGPQFVTNWQTKPEFGATADDNALEEIYSDIRWTNQGPPVPVDPPLQANMDVTPGLLYRLQVLFYGNHTLDNRGWDIRVDGVDAVDNITSLGVNTGAGIPAYSPTMGLAFTYDFIAPDSQVNVFFGQLGIGAPQEQTDFNAIWQGITLELIPEPSIIAMSGLALIGLLRRRRSAP